MKRDMFIINATGDEDVPDFINNLMKDWLENNRGGELVGHQVCHHASIFFDDMTQEDYDNCIFRKWLKEQNIPEDKCMVYIDW